MKTKFSSYLLHNPQTNAVNLVCSISLLAILCITTWSCKESPNTPFEITENNRLEKTTFSITGFDPDDPLMPTGNSTTDTENLQAAFEDPLLDAGGTLYLGPGVFNIHRTVGRQSIDPSVPSYNTTIFNGTIQGAGKGVTIIKAVKGPGGEDFEPINQLLPGDPESIRIYTVIMVEQTYLDLRDLTFDSEPELMWDPDNGKWLAPWRGHNGYGGRGPTMFVSAGSWSTPNQLIGTDIMNAHFIGTVDANNYPTTAHLFQQWGDDRGVHNIMNSEFDNASNGAIQFLYIYHPIINIGGNPTDKVTLTNCINGGIQSQIQ